MNSEMNNKILNIIKEYSKSDEYNYLVDIIEEKLKEKPNLSDKAIRNIIKKEITDSSEIEEDLKKIKISNDEDDKYIDSIINNSEKLYLREIGKIPLLTPEEEKELFTEYSRTHSTEIRKKIINANLRLVVSIANRFEDTGSSLMDLVQVGNFGLMKAIDKFDVTRGYKLSTYASWWIKQEIINEIHKNGSSIYIPSRKVSTIKKIETIENSFMRENGRKPTVQEICDKMEITLEQYKEVLSISKGVVSLSSPITEGEEAELGDFVEDKNNLGPEDYEINKSLSEEFNSYFNRLIDSKILKERDIDIIKKRFGLEDGNPMKLKDVGAIYNVKQERIRQIEAKSLRKMRNDMKYNNTQLREYLNA